MFIFFCHIILFLSLNFQPGLSVPCNVDIVFKCHTCMFVNIHVRF
ncbi:hypothetical protein GLYMA_12G023766v4 [Glycine max]|nr:hypothetical protein GLYMA_12G023766v4 [Glycine max]KAH1141235.1 hypothetical protein GYH30_032476 [Glycine max]